MTITLSELLAAAEAAAAEAEARWYAGRARSSLPAEAGEAAHRAPATTTETTTRFTR
ncbi:MAG: hypothetical protein WKF76_00545 [Nocardioidaceae bacterium]